MADKTINDLTAVTSITGSYTVPIWVGGSDPTRKVTVENLFSIPVNITITAAAFPTVSTIDSTNNVTNIMQSGDSAAFFGTTTAHDVGIIAGNSTRITAKGDGSSVQVDTPIGLVTHATNPQWRVIDTTNTVISKLQSLNSTGLVGTESNHDLEIRTNNAIVLIVTAAGLGDYADDSAASAGGVPVQGIYRNGSVLQIRVV